MLPRAQKDRASVELGTVTQAVFRLPCESPAVVHSTVATLDSTPFVAVVKGGHGVEERRTDQCTSGASLREPHTM